jgi:hypothetical protein
MCEIISTHLGLSGLIISGQINNRQAGTLNHDLTSAVKIYPHHLSSYFVAMV